MDRKSPLAGLVLAASVIAGVSYVASWNMALPEGVGTAWKGAGVALLAVYAGLRARNFDGWLICAVMAFGALGDVLLETHGLNVGAIAFLVGHLIAIGLYLRHRRRGLSNADKLALAVLVPAVAIAAYLLPADRSLGAGAALYSLGLAIMAACAWASRFPRTLVGLGAAMFVVSDLLIFGRAGPLAGAAWVGLAIWGLYYFGQLLICVGVVRGLGRARRL
ncbi:lysoplasmalogenase family protein [Phenylobacterium sp.]|uniref:lysoplasmalogenase family protein n=1 Tax=Phenylobacterium sp. TaxID=1871053 RepID=UPI00289B6541|nr:lysoplasmalogenase family protein [Phenylobacterium sp.]